VEVVFISHLVKLPTAIEAFVLLQENSHFTLNGDEVVLGVGIVFEQICGTFEKQ